MIIDVNLLNIFRMRYLLYALLLLISPQVFSQSNSSMQPQGLEVGEKVPLFSASDQNDNQFNIAEALKKGPVVLIFYRGQWCPHCNKHLSAIQDSLKYINAKGARVVAVSPEKPDLLAKSAEKSGAKFTLLYDEGYKICDAFDVTFRPGRGTQIMYNLGLGADLKNAHSDDSGRLPVPATFIINQEGKIIWKQFDTDYKNRSTVAEILKNL